MKMIDKLMMAAKAAKNKTTHPAQQNTEFLMREALRRDMAVRPGPDIFNQWQCARSTVDVYSRGLRSRIRIHHDGSDYSRLLAKKSFDYAEKMLGYD